MADRQITCIVPDGADLGRRIDKVGGLTWGPLSVDEVVADIEAGRHTYWTTDEFGRRAEVEVARGGLLQIPYLTTSPDRSLPNNLLQLRNCGLF